MIDKMNPPTLDDVMATIEYHYPDQFCRILGLIRQNIK